MAYRNGSTLFTHLVAAFTLGGGALSAQRLMETPRPQPAEREWREPGGSGLARSLQAALLEPQRYQTAGGRVRVASLARSRAYPGGAADAALGFLREHGLGGPIAPSVHQVRELLGLSMVRVRPERDGIPVRGVGASMLVGPGNDVVAFTGDAGDGVTVNADWRVSAEQARGAVKQRYAFVADDLPLERFYQLRGSQAEPFWEAVVSEPKGDWAVHVSAVTGEIERVESLRWGQAQGFAFATNPVKNPVTQVQLGNLTSPANLTGVNAKIYSYLPNLLGLSQPRVFLQVAEPVGGNYLYSPSRPQFSEVQLYHGVDRVAQRFKDLGFGGLDRPLEGVVLFKDFVQQNGQGAFAGQDNAFFTPVEFNNRGGLFFYLTARNLDTSWDSDVIFHEYTHAVVNALVGRSQGNTFRAINEGTADYFAASFLNDPAMGEWASRIFGLRGQALRNVENSNRWPGNLVGEEHVDGNIWSGALWDLRRSLGAERADKIALGSLAVMDGSAEFFDAALAVAVAAKAFFGDTVANTAIDAMVNRGVGTDDAATASKAIALRSGAGSQASIGAAAANSQLLGAQQFRIDVPNQATGLRIQVTASANVRFFIRYRAPVTIQNGQLVFEQFVATPGTNVAGTLGPDNTPELQAGTYYVAITNTTTQAVNYTITATVTGGSPSAPPAVSVLTSGQRGTGSVPAGPFLASRQFAIDVPAGATGLTVSLSGNKDVDLYLAGGSPVFLSSQGYPEADFESASDAVNEMLTITSRSLPDSLQPGRYFIGVQNYSAEAATYSVTATLLSAAVPLTQTQTLAPDSGVSINAPPFAPSSGVGSLVPQQISFTVPADATGVKITASTSLEVDILVKKGSAYNAGGQSDYGYAPTASQPDFEINADSSPALQTGATYFVAIGNYSPAGGPVTLRYSILRRAAGGAAQTGPPKIRTDQPPVLQSFSDKAALSPGTWLQIFGSNFSTVTREWAGSDFTGSKAPTSLEGVRVKVAGKDAFVRFVSPGQVNVQAPDDIGTGSGVTVELTNAGGTSSTTMTAAKVSPALLTTPNFLVGGRQYVAALYPDFTTFVGRVNLIPGVAFRPAKVGDTIIIFAVGCGATNPTSPAGVIAPSPRPLAAPITVRFGQTAATAQAFVGGVGLCQFNVTVPTVAAGDIAIEASVDGVATGQNLFTTIGN